MLVCMCLGSGVTSEESNSLVEPENNENHHACQCFHVGTSADVMVRGHVTDQWKVSRYDWTQEETDCFFIKGKNRTTVLDGKLQQGNADSWPNALDECPARSNELHG